MDIRGWIARKLLNLVNAIDPACKLMVDAHRGWRFERGWKQPVSATASTKNNEGEKHQR